MTRADLDRVMEDVLAKIAAHGWMVQGVFGDTAESVFSYTVGLTEKGLPELFVATLDPRQATPILNDLARLAVARQGLPVDEDIDIDYSIPFRLRGRCLPRDAEAFTAISLYGEQGVDVMQVLWQDAAGRFPTEQGYDQAGFPQRLLPCHGPCIAHSPVDGSPCELEAGHAGRHVGADEGRDG